LTKDRGKRYHVGMYIARVPNRKSHPTILLRESWREGARVRNRTLANLTHWPAEKIAALDQVLKGRTSFGPPLPKAFTISRSRSHGHALAVLGTIRHLQLEHLLAPGPQRQLVIALVAQRLLEPGSKLATARALHPETAHSSLGEQLGLEAVDKDQLYAAMDWLLPQQPAIERALARRHLGEGTLVLYDVTSTYFEGHCCPLAHYGYSRDERRGNPQIVLGVLTNDDGCPVACEVFEGNTADPKTVAAQIVKLRERFGLQQIVLVGDRGMLTQARIEAELRPVEGLEWITALRSVQIQELVSEGALQLSLFDRTDLAEITHPDYPGERLVVCRNPLLAEERARKREDMLAAAEKKLEAIATATRRPQRPLCGPERINYRIGEALGPTKMGKYFRWEITAAGLSFQRDAERIARDAALDGIYVLRTSLPAARLSAPQTVVAYKRLAKVERLFRTLKSSELELRPIHHRLAERVRAHVLICLLAYYVEWHMRRALAPLLFDDEDRPDTTAAPVAPAHCSAAAQDKAARKRTPDQLPVQSFRDLLRHLATIVKNRIEPTLKSVPPFDMITRPDALQQRAFQLLQLSPRLLAT
jgi:Transposase DDE domain